VRAPTSWNATRRGTLVGGAGGPLSLRQQRRPGSVWTPLGLRGPRALPWEQSAATALAHAAGWLPDAGDWNALRQRTLAAAARGNTVADDERMVAVGRIWLAMIDDEATSQILDRVTIHRDPLAVALDVMATSLRANPTLLRADVSAAFSVERIP
jgi:hypothetical protein